MIPVPERLFLFTCQTRGYNHKWSKTTISLILWQETRKYSLMSPSNCFLKRSECWWNQTRYFLAIVRWHSMKATLQRARKTSFNNCGCQSQNKAKRWINARWKFISHPYRRSFHKLGISLTCSVLAALVLWIESSAFCVVSCVVVLNFTPPAWS